MPYTLHEYLLTPVGLPTPAPEPTSALILGCGAVALAGWVRRARG